MVQHEAMLDMVRQALVLTLKISLPLLVAGMAVGLVISVLQSVTSIQDQTIAFVPKVVVLVAVAVLLASWMIQRLVEYTAQLLTFV